MIGRREHRPERRRLRAPALVAFAAAAVIAIPAGGAGAAVPRSFYGVSPQLVPSTADIERMGQGRVGTLRFQLSWAAVEPDPPNAIGMHDYQWGAIDQLVGDAARNGIQALPFVYSTPPWVATELDGRACSSDCYFFPPASSAALDAWAAFLRDAVDRYGPGGSFWAQNRDIRALPIHAWQIWNEQNSPTFFRPSPSAQGYAVLLRRSAAAVRAADPGAEVLLGGMFGTPLGARKPAMTSWKYLRKLYAVPGVEADFDGVAPHPYGSNMDGVRAQLNRIRDEMKRAGDRGTDLWVTEIGWASGGKPNPLNRGPKGQAKRLRQAFGYFRRKRRRFGIRNVTWYSWRDNTTVGPAACSWCPRSGLFKEARLTPKRAWREFVRFTGGS